MSSSAVLSCQGLCPVLLALTLQVLGSLWGIGWKGDRVLWLTNSVLCCLSVFSLSAAGAWTRQQPALIRGLELLQPEGVLPPRGGEGPPDGWLVPTQAKLLREGRCAESASWRLRTGAPRPPEPAR